MKSKTMKLKYLMLSLAGAIALSASAQDLTVPVANQKPARKTTFQKDGTGSHWFITLQGGVGASVLAENERKPILERLRQSYSLSIGKEHSPYFATRLQINGAEAPNFWGTGENEMYKTNFIGGHFDFMFDIVNYFARYNEKRVFHLIPFVGFGYNYKFKGSDFSNHLHAATVNAGVQVNFRLGKRVDLVLEGQGIYSNFAFDVSRWDANAVHPGRWTPNVTHSGLYFATTAGLNFRLGRTTWTEIIPMDYDLIDNLNGQINSLRAENAELSKRPVSCPECPDASQLVEEVETVSVLAPKSVYFRFDSDKVDASQEINLYQIANFVKETNTPIILTGYADVRGTNAYNDKLSERRVKAVLKALVTEYGVDENMISIEWGGETDKYPTKALNRVVIAESK
jgi:outer membrane protein OmpA-like peptidoglycan-associated protein